METPSAARSLRESLQANAEKVKAWPPYLRTTSSAKMIREQDARRAVFNHAVEMAAEEDRTPKHAAYERGKLVGRSAAFFDSKPGVRARAREKAKQWHVPAARAFWLGVARGADEA